MKERRTSRVSSLSQRSREVLWTHGLCPSLLLAAVLCAFLPCEVAAQTDAPPLKVLDLGKVMPDADVVMVPEEVISRQLLKAIGENASDSSLKPAMALAVKGELGKAWLMLNGPDAKADESARLQSAATDYLAFLIVQLHWNKGVWPELIEKERMTVLTRLMHLHDLERRTIRNPGRAMIEVPINVHIGDIFPDLPFDAIVQDSEQVVEDRGSKPVESPAAPSGGVSTSKKVDLDVFLGGRNWRTRCVFTSASLEEATTAYEYIVKRTKEISPKYPVVVDLYDVSDSAIQYYGTGSKYFVGITMRLPDYDGYCEALTWKELKELQSNPQDSVQGNGPEIMRGLRNSSVVQESFRWIPEPQHPVDIDGGPVTEQELSALEKIYFDMGKGIFDKKKLPRPAVLNTPFKWSGNPLLISMMLDSPTSIIRDVIMAGADVNVRSKEELNSPLYHACLGQREDVVALLIKNGADVNTIGRRTEHGAAYSPNMTPLMAASYKGAPAIVKLLLNAGAKVDTRNCDGLTALHYAAEASLECVKLLVEAGADTDARTFKYNQPPARFAAMNAPTDKRDAILDYLDKAKHKSSE